MEVTTDHLKWVKRYINQIRSPTAPLLDAEDLAQEGWIAMWVAADKAHRAGREINDAYLKQAARWTILKSLKRRRYPDIPVEASELPEEPYVLEVGVAAHRAEVLEAVRALPPRQREYVYLRFWMDWNTKSQLGAAGYATSLWYNPNSGAKATLRDKLSHLSTAV